MAERLNVNWTAEWLNGFRTVQGKQCATASCSLSIQPVQPPPIRPTLPKRSRHRQPFSQLRPTRLNQPLVFSPIQPQQCQNGNVKRPSTESLAMKYERPWHRKGTGGRLRPATYSEVYRQVLISGHCSAGEYGHKLSQLEILDMWHRSAENTAAIHCSLSEQVLRMERRRWGYTDLALQG